MGESCPLAAHLPAIKGRAIYKFGLVEKEAEGDELRELSRKVENFDLASNDKNDAKEWIIRNQFGRRNLTPYQRTTLVLTLSKVIEDRAKENQRKSGGDHGNQYTGGKEAVLQNSGEPAPIRTDKELAKIAGVSHDTIWKVQEIQEKATPEEKEELQKGSISVHKVYSNIRERGGEILPTVPGRGVFRPLVGEFNGKVSGGAGGHYGAQESGGHPGTD